jgi:hypothetical protein
MLAAAKTCAGDKGAGADPNAMALTPEPAPSSIYDEPELGASGPFGPTRETGQQPS